MRKPIKTSKICTSCKLDLPLAAFGNRRNVNDGRTAECRRCLLSRNKKWRNATNHKRKENCLRAGITVERYNELLTAQDGRCAVCRKSETALRNGVVKSLAIDHDHITGRIRGLLCARCNTALGLLADNPDLLIELSIYLQVLSAETYTTVTG